MLMAHFADALEDALSSIHDAGGRHALRVVRGTKERAVKLRV